MKSIMKRTAPYPEMKGLKWNIELDGETHQPWGLMVWWKCPTCKNTTKILAYHRFGVSCLAESGSKNTLKNIIGKNVDLDHAKEVIRLCKKLGMFTEAFFIIGSPGETIDDIITTIKYAYDCQVDRPRIYVAIPFPGSRLYDDCVDKGYLSKDFDISKLQVCTTDCTTRHALIDTKDFTHNDVIKLRNIGYKILKEKNYNKYRCEIENMQKMI